MADLPALGGHRGRWIAALLVVLLVAAGVAVGVLSQRTDGDAKGRLATGATRAGDYTTGVASDDLVMEVPNAEILLSATLSSSATNDDDGTTHTVRAPRGGVLLSLEWASRTSFGAASGFVDTRPSALSVRSGGTTVAVDTALRPVDYASVGDDPTQRLLVALPGDRRSVRIVVSFAGREQTLRPASGTRTEGAFAPLYRWTGWGAGTGKFSEQERLADPSADLRWYAGADAGSAYRTPYLTGPGWAPTGKEWLVVSGVGYTVFARPAANWGPTGEVGYTPGKATVTVTANGTAPTKVLTAPAPHRRSGVVHGNGVFVFAIDRGRNVTVRNSVTVPLRRVPGGAGTAAPAHATLLMSTTATYAVARG
ncbi:hypothetical protein [Flexivirga oryzae]|uniref:Uncharacterized protein n=1 Tax=Flexivirga oryzae TaxID=1794944 RepID=A0A839NDL1_9MICO|nr:hypothetical protein [Flexivirga oryzae]MBB2892622.1 hypothetical protein [Flexivirga oryzae]